VCFLLPWKSRHRVRLVGQYRTWTIWQYRSIWLVYQLSSPRVRESANWLTVELPWSGKSSISIRLILTLTLTWHRSMETEKIWRNINAVSVGSSNSRTNLLTQWLRPPVKCCLWITEWLNMVRVRFMVKVRVSVRVVVRARVLSASICFNA